MNPALTTLPAASQAADDCLGLPPPDVQLLLDNCGFTLPLYYDAHQEAALQRSHQEWPGLWRLAQVSP